ncbi:MAG: hypothetical protein LRY67_05785 [Gammaproteobacteria bacterium]|nr:hypothetical protein [Gammaproteobacteria bacterium]
MDEMLCSCNSVAYSPDGQYIASNHWEVIRQWEATTGQAFGPVIQGYFGTVNSVAYSPDGRYLASSSADTVRQWEADTGQPFRPVMEGHTDVVCSVAYSPDGHYIASGGWDKTVHQWIAATGQPFGLVMEGHTGKVYSVAYSPNGRYIASGSSDYTVRQWIAATGSPFGPVMQGHFQTVNSVAYSPNGEHLVSGGKDNRIIVWQALTGFLVWCTRSPWMFLCAIDLRLTKYSIGLQPDQYALLEYAGCSEADDVIRVMASSNLNLREKFLYSISNNLHDLYLNICIRHTVLPNREYLQLASDLLFQININVPDEQKNFIMLVTMSSLLTQEEKSAYINQIDGRLLPQNWQEDFLVWENICKTRSVSDLDIHDVHLKAWQLMLIGLDCIEKGDHQLAKNYFERSLEINPSNALTVKNFFYELTDEMSSLYDLQYAKRLMKDFLQNVEIIQWWCFISRLYWLKKFI